MIQLLFWERLIRNLNAMKNFFKRWIWNKIRLLSTNIKKSNDLLLFGKDFGYVYQQYYYLLWSNMFSILSETYQNL